MEFEHLARHAHDAHRNLSTDQVRNRGARAAIETLGLTATIRAIPIVEPEAMHTIGLVVPMREPMTPLATALVAEARRLAVRMGEKADETPAHP